MRSSKQLWFAGVAAGSIVVAASGHALAQDINEKVTGPSSGVVAARTGTQNVTVTITASGNVDNPTGTAVTATAQQGNVTVIDHGAVTGAGGGILGQTSGPNVSITVDQGVTAGTADAVEALDLSNGAASVKVGSGQNAAHPLTITTGSGGAGVGAISVTGNTSVDVGNNVAISAGVPGESGVADVVALGLFTPADTDGPSAAITVGSNATLNLDGNRASAVSAQIGQNGISGPANGTASASVNVGNGVAIDVHGLTDAGVIGFVTDLAPADVYNGFGDVTVKVGSGTINVDEVGAIGSATGAMANIGEGAFSDGGNVSVTNAADITVSGGLDRSTGISAITAGAGAATVADSGSITSNNGVGIVVTTGSGLATANVTGGALVASGIGIDATSTSGNVVVTTAKSVSIDAGGAGISAVTGGAGSVTVTSAGAIVSTGGDGIDASTTNGLLTVAVGGDVISDGVGVKASSASGPIAITIGKSATVAAGGIGVGATSAGSIVVDDEGKVAAGGSFLTGPQSNGVFAQSTGGSVALIIDDDVSTAAGTDAVEALASGSGSATVTVGSGSHANPLGITGGTSVAVLAVSVFGPASVTAGDNVSVSAGAAGASRVADINALAVLTSSGLGADVAVGRNATLTLAGNSAAAVSAQIGQSGIEGPAGGTASATASVGNGVAISVSGFNDAGVIAFVTDLSAAPVYFGFGNASVTVGTGAINVNEVGAFNPPAFAVNIGEGAFSAGGNVTISNAANIVVNGVLDVTEGLSTDTGGNGSSAITTSGNITVNNGEGVLGRTQNGANGIDILGGVITGSAAGVEAESSGSGAVTVDVAGGASLNGAAGLRASSGTGAIVIDNAGLINGGGAGGLVAETTGALTSITNESGGQIVGPGFLGAPALSLVGAGAYSVDNRGFIGTQMTDHTGLILFEGVVSGLSITNEAGGVLDGVLSAGGNVTFNNAGTWETAGSSDFGAGAPNALTNTGLIQIGQSGANGAPSAAAFLDLGALDNGSAGATGVISMVNRHVGDTLTVSGLFTGAVGHSLLELDAQLGGPGSTADQLILQGGSAGQTLIRINDVLHGHAALNPAGILLVQGSSAASTFALDPTQAGYDPATKGIDKGLFTYPLVFSGGDELLVGEPGLPARQLATMGAAAEDVWSSTSPGDQSEAHLAASLANGGGDETGGLRVWAQAVNGGPSRLNGGQTMLGRANFADDPSTGGGPPLAGVVQQTSSVSAYGMTYGFNTGYAQNVSALLTGVDLGRRVGDQDAWSWGVSTGYLESQQSFTAGASVAQYQGALAALHGAYVNANGFHVAGDLKVTALQVSYLTAWGGGGASTPNAAIDTFGGEADAGWTRGIGGGWTLEPVASLSLQSSKLGALTIAGTDVRFGDASSARLGFGAKLSGGGQLFGLTWKSQSTLQMWDELRGANTLELTSAGAGQVLPDPIGGTFTDASQSFSLQSADGRASAFVSGAYRWKSDYQAAQLSMGLKLAW